MADIKVRVNASRKTARAAEHSDVVFIGGNQYWFDRQTQSYLAENIRVFTSLFLRRRRGTDRDALSSRDLCQPSAMTWTMNS